MKVLTLKIPPGLDTQLESYARNQNMSKSQVIRIALDEYFSKDQNQSSGSAVELSADLAGSVEAPSDLASNKDHLQGYGA